MEADAILAATDKAKGNEAWMDLSDSERAGVDRAVNQLLVAYNSDDYTLIREHIERVNEATMKLAENMMNTAVRGRLRGSKIDDLG